MALGAAAAAAAAAAGGAENAAAAGGAGGADAAGEGGAAAAGAGAVAGRAPAAGAGAVPGRGGLTAPRPVRVSRVAMRRAFCWVRSVMMAFCCATCCLRAAFSACRASTDGGADMAEISLNRR